MFASKQISTKQKKNSRPIKQTGTSAHTYRHTHIHTQTQTQSTLTQLQY